jgi:hypothetical protein
MHNALSVDTLVSTRKPLRQPDGRRLDLMPSTRQIKLKIQRASMCVHCVAEHGRCFITRTEMATSRAVTKQSSRRLTR